MRADSEMLQKLNIMDYSLLFGIEKQKTAMVSTPMNSLALKVGFRTVSKVLDE